MRSEESTVRGRTSATTRHANLGDDGGQSGHQESLFRFCNKFLIVPFEGQPLLNSIARLG